MTDFYKAHGEFCASHPWEVIVATLTLTACLLSIETENVFQYYPQKVCGTSPCQEYNAFDVIVMTTIRCVAVLYSYYQFRNLQKLGSKYIFGIAGLFTVFSSFVFSTSVINCLTGNISDLKDALFFFLLLIDLSKATLLAQFALSASTQDEVRQNIARGMSLLGPSLTLDTLVETLVISVGTLSGIRRLEILCYFACLSVLVNYVVFMTFYPACLSLILELSYFGGTGSLPAWHQSSKIIYELKEHNQKPNPVLQKVKVIMSGGLVFVHLHSRWNIKEESKSMSVMTYSGVENEFPGGDYFLQNDILRWVAVCADHIVILIILLALTVKFVFFEDKDELISSKVYDTKRNNREEDSVKILNSFTQTDENAFINRKDTAEEKEEVESVRSSEECISVYKKKGFAGTLTDSEIILLIEKGIFPIHQLEKLVNNPVRGVNIRRKVFIADGGPFNAIQNIPFEYYDYAKVYGACCENVIGYIPIPLGLAGPLKLDGESVYIPMATTEGCLVASTNRGCRALSCNGVTSRVVADGMTRGPVVRFPSITRASEAMYWMQNTEKYVGIKESFDSTSRFARLTKLHVRVAGRLLFIRFVAVTGDAMGMNMTSKGTEVALKYIQNFFPDMEIISLSGNVCSDKKPAAVNWIEGRGKSVVCEGIVPGEVVRSILKTTVEALVDVNITKNLIGSAVAGSVGGFNAHAANIVTAIYIATGQDAAQNVGSSNCMTLVEPWGEAGEDLYMAVTMPSIEVGTIGGGTQLPAQAACLQLLEVQGPHLEEPGEHASRLARIVCAGVLAGELSLLSALAAGHLVRSHLRHNRSSTFTLPSLQ